MSDETTSGFTFIEEDNVSGEDAEKHLTIEVTDFLGDGSNLKSYLNVGAWEPAAAAGTTVAGKLAEPVFGADGQPDPEGGFTRDESGDDMLAPFLYNLFIDDQRDRSEGDDSDVDNVAFPGVDLSAHAKPPGLDAVKGPSHVTHGGDDPFYLDPSLRAAVTKAMPTFVGWRDHTEGHRISTTRGDKIEIVGGNSKLFVLGRGSGTVHTDWSGGHVVDTMEAPGLVTSVNWRKVPTGEDPDELGWQWVEETVKGNVIERFHGTYKSEHYGDEIIEIIGRSDESAPEEVPGLEDVGEFDAVRLDEEEDNRWDGPRPTARSKPRVIEQAYVASSFEETIVDGNIIDIDRAKTIVDYVGVRPRFDDEGNLAGELESGERPELVREYLFATHHAEDLDADVIEEELVVDDFNGRYDVKEAREIWIGAFAEIFAGAKTQILIAPISTFGIAARLEAYLGLETKLVLGMTLEGKVTKTKVTGKRSEFSATKSKAHQNRISANLAEIEAKAAVVKAGLDSADLAIFRHFGPS